MALCVNSLTKRFDRVVIDQFTYQFDYGKLYVIKGVSGCGKTTLLNVLGGLDRKYEGKVSLDGRFEPEHLMIDVGYIFQHSLLIADLTIRDNLLLIRNDAAKIDAVMRRLGVSDLYDKYPAELSGGERQRVAVVRALITGARVLLADEPTASLDEINSVEIAALLSELCDEGCTVIVATHEHYFNELADEIIYLNYGKIERVESCLRKSEVNGEKEHFQVKMPEKPNWLRQEKKSKEKMRKGKMVSLLKILFSRGKKHWKVSSLLSTMIMVILILLISTATHRIDAILLGYLELYYPSDLVKMDDSILNRLDQNIIEELTIYYPYVAEADGVRALYYAEKEDSVLSTKGMLKYGYFPERQNEIIVSFEFAEEKFGSINTEEDIIGRKYQFADQEFVISGCLHSFDESVDLGFFYNTVSLFDNDIIYAENRGSMIFVDYKLMKEIGEILEERDIQYMASYDDVMRNKEVREKLHGRYRGQYSINSIESIIKNTEYGMERVTMILYVVLVICFLIVCIFIRSKVEIELFYRSREIGFLQVFRMGKKKLKRMILWEYLVQLAVAFMVPFGIYVLLMTVASWFLNAVMIFNTIHMMVVFGLLLLLYVQALTGAIRKYLKQDVVELIRG